MIARITPSVLADDFAWLRAGVESRVANAQA
jgi:hypothetical protein